MNTTPPAPEPTAVEAATNAQAATHNVEAAGSADVTGKVQAASGAQASSIADVAVNAEAASDAEPAPHSLVPGIAPRWTNADSAALDEAMQRAETLFTKCPHCKEVVCQDCFSARDNSCRPCLEEASRTSAEAGAKAQEAQRAAKGHACPNCNTDTQGGRFCPECGYDMASTHKSCPQCGLMMARQARFCTDCGHSF